jgi:penicillin-insensitive murein endopeptidase
MANWLIRSIVILLVGCGIAAAQDLGTMTPKPLPPLAHPEDPKTAAKELFGRETKPVHSAPVSIGYYTNGCITGAMALPINGPTWQVMRLSRNRNWGHPQMISLLERFSKKATKIGWPGLLVGDMAQPRGGPMISGHWSHQVGLDADVWFSPMPDHEYSRQEREEMSATNLVADDWKDVNPERWTPTHIALLKTLASFPEVERVLVNPAIKKALCRDVTGDRSWLHKMRPVAGHNYHFHIRISCPKDSPNCREQKATPVDEGCGKDLDWWFTRSTKEPTANPHAKPMPISAMPEACRAMVRDQAHSE